MTERTFDELDEETKRDVARKFGEYAKYQNQRMIESMCEMLEEDLWDGYNHGRKKSWGLGD